jgi:hypothetical protein
VPIELPIIVKTPTFSLAPGMYTTAQIVIVITTNTIAATIRYTLDGTVPSATNGTVYTGSITLSMTSILQAIAYETGSIASAIASGTYTFEPIPEPLSEPIDVIIRAGISRMDDCPILTRINAFIVSQGVTATLEHVFRDQRGRVVDLSRYLSLAISESISSSTTIEQFGSVVLNVKEWIAHGLNPKLNPFWEITGQSYDPEKGLIRAELPTTLVEHPGIYELGWGIKDQVGRLVLVNQSMLSVERSLFAANRVTRDNNLGPVTINEIRLSIMDSSPSENTLLDDLEFSDVQIGQAITEPIRIWNEMLPDLKREFTTRDFPWRSAWLSAIAGKLHLMAANHYRRNLLKGSAGGIQSADKDKEREYMAEGQRLMQEYKDWAANKKVAINMRQFVGYCPSAYISHDGW